MHLSGMCFTHPVASSCPEGTRAQSWHLQVPLCTPEPRSPGVTPLLPRRPWHLCDSGSDQGPRPSQKLLLPGNSSFWRLCFARRVPAGGGGGALQEDMDGSGGMTGVGLPLVHSEPSSLHAEGMVPPAPDGPWEAGGGGGCPADPRAQGRWSAPVPAAGLAHCQPRLLCPLPRSPPSPWLLWAAMEKAAAHLGARVNRWRWHDGCPCGELPASSCSHHVGRDGGHPDPWSGPPWGENACLVLTGPLCVCVS